MKFRHMTVLSLASAAVIFLLSACSAFAGSSATLLLEEPYGTLGFFTGTGHAAVYLSGVCAETPLVLRPCLPGETGAVISRYDGIGSHDWVAIPLIPYLYAVERAEDVPLFADARMAAFLRDHYRRKYLEAIAPDVRNEETPGGNWYQLVGSSYDRTTYAFEIETTPEQDLALIQTLNSSPNISHFHILSRNCADFAKDIINFYYPKALRRSVSADVGITTPKQIAKMLTKFSTHHPEIRFSRVVIAQVPGIMPRSTTAHGVVESFFKSKKYIVPSAVVSPIFAGCVAGVYFGSGAGRFKPAHDANVFVAGQVPESPIDREDIRAYQAQLKHYLAGAYPETSARRVGKAWEKLQASAIPSVDSQGRPILVIQAGVKSVRVGVSASNVMDGNSPPELARQLLEARLESVFRRPSPHSISESQVERDWSLLNQAVSQSESRLTARSAGSAEIRGNQQ
jgi:hypothetical protein